MDDNEELRSRIDKAINIDWDKVKPEDFLTPEEWRQRLLERHKKGKEKT